MNEEIAEIFDEMADILELKKVRWKPQAYRIAAQTLGSLDKDVKKIYEKGGEKALDELPGIGEGIAKKIIEYIKTGKIKKLQELKKSVPSGLYDIMNIPGIGPKKAALFSEKLNINSIKELEKAAREGKLKSLPLIKEKTEKNILESISLFKDGRRRVSYREAEKIAIPLLKELKKIRGIKKMEIAGSFRRKKPTIGDFDIVILTDNPEKVADKFVKLSLIKKVLGKGKDKVTVILNNNIQADLRFFNKENYGSGLLYFTGDRSHNIWLRKIAIKKGYKLSEYGLSERKTGKKIAGRTEKEIYSKLNLKFPEPGKRIGETE